MTGNHIRLLIIKQAYEAKESHIGSALSIADIVATLYDSVLQGSGPADPNRDRFVLYLKGMPLWRCMLRSILRGMDDT